VIPTDFNLSTPNAEKTYDSAELTGTLGLTSLASSTYTRLGLDTEADPDTPGGACTPSDVSGIQDLNQFTFSSAEVTAGSAPVTTYFTGLRSLTKYCWQQVVTLSDGDTQSSDWIVFDTTAYLAPLITVSDNSTSNIGSTSAIANATINDAGVAGVATAQLGTPSGGSCSAPTGVSSAATNGLTGNSSTQTVGPTLTGLQPSTSCCWREAFAVAGGVTDDGAWISFTTSAAPAGGGGGGGGAGSGAGSPGSGGGGAPGKSLVGAFTSLDLASPQKGTSVALSLVIGNAGSTITVNVYAPQAEVATAAKAKHHKKPSLVLLGHLSEIVSASGPLKLKVSLNAKGKAALNARGHMTVTVDTSVTPPGGTAESSSNAVTLHRHH
jgi:hypothetical protein